MVAENPSMARICIDKKRHPGFIADCPGVKIVYPGAPRRGV